VNFGGAFIDPRKAGTGRVLWDALVHLGPSPVPLARLLDQIDHVARVAGPDHVGLGSDFDGASMPDGMEDCSMIPKVTEALLRRGYTDDAVQKILGGNTLRVLEAAERVSREMQ
jgi:membrane dipeptidase